MVDHRHCWLVVVPSVLVWMGVVVANGLAVASTVFGIVLGACYADVFFLEYVDVLLHEDQNHAII